MKQKDAKCGRHALECNSSVEKTFFFRGMMKALLILYVLDEYLGLSHLDASGRIPLL